MRTSQSHEERSDNKEDIPPEPDLCSTIVIGEGDGELGVLTRGAVGSWTFMLNPPLFVVFALKVGLGVI